MGSNDYLVLYKKMGQKGAKRGHKKTLPGEGRIILRFKKFRSILRYLCVGTAPQIMGTALQNIRTASQNMGTARRNMGTGPEKLGTTPYLGLLCPSISVVRDPETLGFCF